MFQSEGLLRERRHRPLPHAVSHGFEVTASHGRIGRASCRPLKKNPQSIVFIIYRYVFVYIHVYIVPEEEQITQSYDIMYVNTLIYCA